MDVDGASGVGNNMGGVGSVGGVDGLGDVGSVGSVGSVGGVRGTGSGVGAMGGVGGLGEGAEHGDGAYTEAQLQIDLEAALEGLHEQHSARMVAPLDRPARAHTRPAISACTCKFACAFVTLTPHVRVRRLLTSAVRAVGQRRL